MDRITKLLPSVGNIVVMLLLIGLVVALIVGVPKLFGPVPPGEIQMGLVVVLTVVVLLTLLTVMAAVFSRLGLSDSRQPLGLPEGSIRALIALFLIMIFIIMSVYLFRTIVQEDATPAAEQLALQMVTLLGTLVTAVSAFYFGSATTRVPPEPSARPDVTTLSIDSITPSSAQATGGAVNIELIGIGFAAGVQVKLRLAGAADIDATNVTVVDATKITCTFNFGGSQVGRWDVVVINPDGRQAGKSGLFQIV